MVEIIAQALNYTLSFLFWMLIGRVALIMLVGDRRNLFTQVVYRATDPVLGLVRRTIPGSVGDRYAVVIALPVLVILRLALLPFLRQ